VDDGAYTLEGTNRLTIRKEFPSVTFTYTLKGKTIRFTPQIPKTCSTFRCAWSLIDGDPRHQLDSPLRLAAVSELRGADSACHA
jgi:hypothetical protein